MNITKERRDKILAKLNNFRIISTDNPVADCYGWSGSVKNKTTSPRILIEGIVVGAHRAAWMAEYGKIPTNQYIHKSCENKLCTNPKHLFISPSRINEHKTGKKPYVRPGRERLSVDLPASLVQEIRRIASRYHQTITKYLLKRLSEVMEYEKRLDNRNKS